VLLNPGFIKNDQTFFRPHHERTQDDSLWEIIISLGNQLEMTMLAEGIETRGQLEQLCAPGCELGQGFLLSAAVSAAEAAAMLDRVPGSSWLGPTIDVTAR
jgi:EAL domain-containing protein (putative c-di-GMP-specific phosphodiesterase class I)